VNQEREINGVDDLTLRAITANQPISRADWLYCPTQQTGLPFWHESLQICGESELDGLMLDPSMAYFEAQIVGQFRYTTLGIVPLAEIRIRILAEKSIGMKRLAGRPLLHREARHHQALSMSPSPPKAGEKTLDIGISWFRNLTAQTICPSLVITSNPFEGMGVADPRTHRAGKREVAAYAPLKPEPMKLQKAELTPYQATPLREASRREVLLFVRKALLLPRCAHPLLFTRLRKIRDINSLRASLLDAWAEVDNSGGRVRPPRANSAGNTSGETRTIGLGQSKQYQLLLWRDLLNDQTFLWLRGFPLQAQVMTNQVSRFGGSVSAGGRWSLNPMHHRDTIMPDGGIPVANSPSREVRREDGETNQPPSYKLTVEEDTTLPILFEFARSPVLKLSPPVTVCDVKVDTRGKYGIADLSPYQPNPRYTIAIEPSNRADEGWFPVGRIVRTFEWETPRQSQVERESFSYNCATPGGKALRVDFLRPWLLEPRIVAIIRQGSRYQFPLLGETNPGQIWSLHRQRSKVTSSGNASVTKLNMASVERNNPVPRQDSVEALAIRGLKACDPLSTVGGSFVPLTKQIATKLVANMPTPRWRMTILTSFDGFQTAVISKSLHLIRFVACLWTHGAEEFVEVAIQLRGTTHPLPLASNRMRWMGFNGHPCIATDARRCLAMRGKRGVRWPPPAIEGGAVERLLRPEATMRTRSQPALLSIPSGWGSISSPVTGEITGALGSSMRSSPSPCIPDFSASKGLRSERLLLTESDSVGLETKGAPTALRLGQFLPLGGEVAHGQATPVAGQVVTIERKKITLRRTQALLFYAQGGMHVNDGEWVDRGSPILTLTYQKLVTGDIVQGIPKIEQFFEAPNTREGEPLVNSLQARVKRSFERLRRLSSVPQAVKGSIEDIQQTLVDGILKVYLSQGVRIADKHLEIVVRQMTSKGQIVDAGDTGLFRGEQVDLGRIERINLATYGQRAEYEPAVLGITRAALDSESFISAASFQETTRVLSRDTIIGKTDFLRGLKERVVLGDLIQAGTGLDDNINYGLLFGAGNLEEEK
jgi:hypothetical protein